MMGKHLSNENDSESVFDSGHKPELVASNVEDRQTTYPFCAGKGSFQFGLGSPVRMSCQLVPSNQRVFRLRVTLPEIDERPLAYCPQ